jgi:hypothetical protein
MNLDISTSAPSSTVNAVHETPTQTDLVGEINFQAYKISYAFGVRPHRMAGNCYLIVAHDIRYISTPGWSRRSDT